MLHFEVQGFNKFHTWDRLTRYGDNRIVQLSAVFPFVGHFILFGDKIHQWVLNLSPEYALDLPIWTQVSIYSLYYGLLCLGIGTIFYAIFCPPEVKKSRTSADYGHLREWSGLEAEKFRKWIHNNLDKYVSDKHDKNNKLGVTNVPDSPDTKMMYYEMQAMERPNWSRITGILYFFGIALTSVSALISLLRISSHLFIKIIG